MTMDQGCIAQLLLQCCHHITSAVARVGAGADILGTQRALSRGKGVCGERGSIGNASSMGSGQALASRRVLKSTLCTVP